MVKKSRYMKDDKLPEKLMRLLFLYNLGISISEPYKTIISKLNAYLEVANFNVTYAVWRKYEIKKAYNKEGVHIFTKSNKSLDYNIKGVDIDENTIITEVIPDELEMGAGFIEFCDTISCYHSEHLDYHVHFLTEAILRKRYDFEFFTF